MEKPKIIVYHNTILDRKVYIVVFINQPFNFDLDFDKAKKILQEHIGKGKIVEEYTIEGDK